MTGASGGIGTRLRKLLPPIYPDLLLSDIRPPADLGANEQFKAADLSDLAQCEALCEGVDGIIHFGGYSVEGPWDDILQANIIGGYNLFEAAYRKGVKRVVFASSNHDRRLCCGHQGPRWRELRSPQIPSRSVRRCPQNVQARPDGLDQKPEKGLRRLWRDQRGARAAEAVLSCARRDCEQPAIPGLKLSPPQSLPDNPTCCTA